MVPVAPTSKTAVKNYFGTPETEAERYFYYGCAEVFDKGGKLIAARIPYNNNSQYLTPAVRYSIKQYETKSVENFTEDGNGTTVGMDGTVEADEDSFYTEAATGTAENGAIWSQDNFIYDEMAELPELTKVKRLTEDGYEECLAVKRYKIGETTYDASLNPRIEYIEVRLDAVGKQIVEDATDLVDAASKLFTEANKDAHHFCIVDCKYNGQMSDSTVDLSSYFNAAPVTADVTNSTDYGDIGSQLKIDPLTNTEFNASNYPVVEVKTVFGKKMRVLTALKNNDTTTPAAWRASGDSYGEDGMTTKSVIYQLVTNYDSIKAIATAGSQNYRWIRWEIPQTANVVGDSRDRALIASMLGCRRADVPNQLSEIRNVTAIVPQAPADDYGFIELSTYQDYRDGAAKPAENEIVIANVTEHCFGIDKFNNAGEEILGIVPVLVGGFQSLPRQSRIEIPADSTNGRIFNAVEELVRGKSINGVKEQVDIRRYVFEDGCTAKTLANTESYDPFESTYSNDLVGRVPAIGLNASYKPNGTQVNGVTLAVCQLSLSSVDDNKIAITVMETFTGSLDPTATDEKGNSTFIDTLVNSEDTGSSYVRMFSNFVNTIASGKVDETAASITTVEEPTLDNTVTLTLPADCRTSEWFVSKKPSMSLGFTKEQTKKYIAYSTITAALEGVFDALSNIDENEIDLVVDCGLSSIANRIKLLGDKDPDEIGKYEYDIHYDKISGVEDIAAWKSICSKFLTFCSTTRKDCMALIDAPRSLAVKDGVKMVRPGSKYSLDIDVLPKFNYLAGLNSSYGAGYCDWLCYVDDFSGKNVWLPPSIAAEGSMILTDRNYNYWDAPAGEKRGVVTAAFDVAFNPNKNQADSIYSKSWNYAVSDSTQGIMLWGQKTLLSSSAVSAFDRINVRRLFLRLERMTYKFLKSFIFENNTAKIRNRIVDGLDPLYSNVKTMGGLYDYQLICSERNNTPTVIDNNELRCAVLLKPVRVLEFCIVDFYGLSTGMDFTEVYSEL